MSRPTYETERDRSNERDVIKQAGHRWPGIRVTKLPRFYPVDYWASQPPGGALVEIKCRNYDSAALDRMGGLIIGLGKWSAAYAMSRVARRPLILWLRTTDGYWHHSTENFLHDGIAISGREDRGDTEDREPCIKLCMDRFIKFAGRAE